MLGLLFFFTPAWWNGRRYGLKIRWSNPCGFESHRRYQERDRNLKNK